MSTTFVREDISVRKWYLVDAAGRPAGRLAVVLANVLRGKTKPSYSPHTDNGDFVVVINADKVKLTGNKEEQKIYKDYSGFPDGLKTQKAETVRAKNPTRIIRQAVKGMLPDNNIARTLMTRIKIYAGTEHPHAAQKLQPVKL